MWRLFYEDDFLAINVMQINVCQEKDYQHICITDSMFLFS